MGIDLERFPDVNPELICSICAGVLEDPVELPCRHVFCSACISRWLNTQHSCPNCRKKVRGKDLKPALPLLRNIINKLKIRCEFAQNGCAELVELEQLGTHSSACPFAPMTCENEGCEITFPRRSKAQHEAECPKRKILCSTTCLQGCGLELCLSDVAGHNCVQSLRSRVQELEKKLSDYSQRMTTLEQTVNKLQQGERKRHSSGGSGSRTETPGQVDVDSGLISLVSDDEEGGLTASSQYGHPLLDPNLSDLDVANAILTGRLPQRNRDREQRRSLRQRSPRRERSRSRSPRRERSRSRSPLRQDDGEDMHSDSRRNRERSPCGSTSRNRRRSGLLSPFSVSSPSTSHSSSNTCETSDSSVVHSTSRRSVPAVRDDSSSVQSSPLVIRHSDSDTEYDFEDGIPEYAVFFSPPGSSETISVMGDRRIHQWLQSTMEIPSGNSTDSSSSSSTSC